MDDTWGGWAGAIPETPCTHPATSPIYREILCAHDWAMSKQKLYSKNKTSGSFTNSELSKQKKFSKNMIIINCCFSCPLAVVTASEVRLSPSTHSSYHFYHPSVSCRDPAPEISRLNLFIKVPFLMLMLAEGKSTGKSATPSMSKYLYFPLL